MSEQSAAENPRTWQGFDDEAIEEAQRVFSALVGECVRARRQRLGWGQQRLGEEAHLSSNYVARIERGEVCISFFVAYRLATALGGEVQELLRVLAPSPTFVKPPTVEVRTLRTPRKR